MGGIIQACNLPSTEETSRLIVYSRPELAPCDAFSINKPLAEKLIKVSPSRRTMRLEQCFNELIAALPIRTVIKDIDVMFNPNYMVDVMRALISANKQKPISVIWPGRYADGKLYYSEETLPDYRVFEINDYDIFCVI